MKNSEVNPKIAYDQYGNGTDGVWFKLQQDINRLNKKLLLVNNNIKIFRRISNG